MNPPLSSPAFAAKFIPLLTKERSSFLFKGKVARPDMPIIIGRDVTEGIELDRRTEADITLIVTSSLTGQGGLELSIRGHRCFQSITP